MTKIVDIAKKCNVSTATVSRALNNQSEIKETTKLRIRKVAEEMGYMTNASARALKTNHTYNLGVLFFDGTELLISHTFFSGILDSFKNEAELKGYDITFMNRQSGTMPKASFLQHAKYRNFDGVAIIEANFNSEEILELVDSDIPIVTIDHPYRNASCILSDNRDGMYALVSYAIEKGHKKIAYLHGENTYVTKERLDGYYLALKANNIEVNEQYVKSGKYHDLPTCEKAFKELLELKDRPTCILIPEDYVYLGIQRVLKESNIKVKSDISIIGYDGAEISDVLDLTTYRQNTHMMGKLAADKLINLIENDNATVEKVVVAGELIERNSVKKLKNN